MFPLSVPQKLLNLIHHIEHRRHGSCYFVGGCVRDYLMAHDPSKDIDIEVFGLTVDELKRILDQKLENVKFAGNQFPVFHTVIDGYEIQFSLPRLERAINSTHKGFEIIVNPYMSVSEAAIRRDTTINAIYMTSTGNVIDPFNGREAIEKRVITPVSKHFKEDPVRALRIFRQASQFGFIPSFIAIDYAKELYDQFNTIEPDLIAKEWLKWSQSKYPHIGLQFLVDCGWINHFALLAQLENTVQSTVHHPEGNVLNHTLLVLENAGQFQDSVLTFSALFHDIGKIRTTVVEEDGRITSKRHESVGCDMIEDCFSMLHANFFKSYYDKVKETVLLHMNFHNVNEISNKSVLKIIRKMKHNNFLTLIQLICCDVLGRYLTTQQQLDSLKVIVKLQSCYENILPLLERNSIKKIIDGKFLIDNGLTPSPRFSKIIDAALDAQIEGEVTESNKQQWLNDFLRL